MVKPLPATRETWVRSLGWEDPLEKEMATQPSTLAWKIPWMDEPGRLQSMGSQRVGHDWVTSLGSRNYSKYLKHFNSFYSSHESCEVFKKMYIIWILQMSLLKHRKVNSLCRAAKWQRLCLQCTRPGFDPWVGKILWRRKWLSTPVLLPGKFHGRRGLAGYSSWGRKESDTTEWLTLLPIL